jgi:hypothetical protein
VPAASLPPVASGGVAMLTREVTLWRPRHAAVRKADVAAVPPARVQAMPQAVADWLIAHGG